MMDLTKMPHTSFAGDVAEQGRRAAPGAGEARRTPGGWETTNDDPSNVVRVTSRKPYLIRRVTFADSELLVELLTRLSERTRRLRYMAPRPMSGELAWAEASRMAQGQTHDHLTLLAILQRADNREVIGVAELIRTDRSPRQAELAVVVRDDHQGQGIGRSLVEQLVERAASLRIDSVRVDMLAENRAMLRLLGGLALPKSTTTRYGETELVMRVPPRPNGSTCSADAATAGSD